MSRHRLSAVTVALLASALGCSNAPSTVRCDEPDNSCNRPFLQSVTPLSALRNPVAAQRLAVGTAVDARNLQVTAFDTYDETLSGAVGTVYVQQTFPAGDTTDRFLPCPLLNDDSGRVCGISTFQTAFNPLAYRPMVGDLIDMSGGSYDEFDCSGVCGTPPQPFPNGLFLPQVRAPTIRAAGVAPLPTPIRVTVDDLLNHNAALIGVLVQVDNVSALAEPNCRGEIVLSAGSNGVAMTQEMVAIPHGEARVDPRAGRTCPNAPPAMVPPDPDRIRNGTRWGSVVGVVSYFYGPKLIPRTLADLTPAG